MYVAQCRYDYSMGGGGVFGSEDEDEDEDEGPAAAAGGNSYDDSQQGKLGGAWRRKMGESSGVEIIVFLCQWLHTHTCACYRWRGHGRG